jgi:hypothetical protein
MSVQRQPNKVGREWTSLLGAWNSRIAAYSTESGSSAEKGARCSSLVAPLLTSEDKRTNRCSYLVYAT